MNVFRPGSNSTTSSTYPHTFRRSEIAGHRVKDRGSQGSGIAGHRGQRSPYLARVSIRVHRVAGWRCASSVKGQGVKVMGGSCRCSRAECIHWTWQSPSGVCAFRYLFCRYLQSSQLEAQSLEGGASVSISHYISILEEVENTTANTSHGAVCLYHILHCFDFLLYLFTLSSVDDVAKCHP